LTQREKNKGAAVPEFNKQRTECGRNEVVATLERENKTEKSSADQMWGEAGSCHAGTQKGNL